MKKIEEGDSFNAPLISVIVPCRNEGQYIRRSLMSIMSQEIPYSIEVIVADGMSDDGTREILSDLAKKDTRVKIVDNPAQIVSTGLNSAIKSARGQIIIRMDAHTEYAPDYVRQCVQVLHDTGADNVGGAARTRSDGFFQRAVAAAYHSKFSVGGARFHNEHYEGYVDTVTYGCWRRDVFDRYGYFDEELVRNQDDEHNLRISLKGGKIWQSRAIKSWYRPRYTLRDLIAQYAQYGYWKVRILQKYGRTASLRHLVPGAFVLSTLILATASLFSSQALAVLLVLFGSYSGASLIASAITARCNDWRLFGLLPVVFACYHFSYGIGFLWGIWDFIITGKGRVGNFNRLSRGARSSEIPRSSGREN